MQKQIESEREERARVEVQYDRVMERVSEMEKIIGCDPGNKQPACVIDLENKIVEMRARQAQDTQLLRGTITQNIEEQNHIRSSIALMKSNMSIIERQGDLRDK